ncbi:hypothetical protein HK105_209465 [Polyrhizophydium stewartii]|uniref:Peptidase A1 domain-containing protein n=1 Tax=Polyrhizophydium stewartii TaxID=2732419 RepID=A0ABR4MV11_9FUNG
MIAPFAVLLLACGALPAAARNLVDDLMAQGMRAGRGPNAGQQPALVDFVVHPSAVGVQRLAASSFGLAPLGTASIGTPAQRFTMLFDTGSSLTWVRSDLCQLPTACVGQTAFDHTKSSTFLFTGTQSASVDYADGSRTVCRLATDTFALGDAALRNTSICVATIVQSKTSPSAFDGIIGVGPEWTAASSNTPFISLLNPSAGLPAGLVSFWFDVEQSTSAARLDGEIAIGGANLARFFDSPAWVPIVQGSTHWTTPVSAISVGSGKDEAQIALNGGIDFIVDTGTSVSVLPAGIVSAIRARLPPTSVDSTGLVGLDCGNAPSIPRITVTFGTGAAISLSGEQLSISVVNNASGAISCILGLRQGDTPILGASILKELYTIFDNDNKTVGFAQRAPFGVVGNGTLVSKNVTNSTGSDGQKSKNRADAIQPNLLATGIALGGAHFEYTKFSSSLAWRMRELGIMASTLPPSTNPVIQRARKVGQQITQNFLVHVLPTRLQS